MKYLFTFFTAIFVAMSTFGQLWTATPTFDSPRNSQTITLLEDGRAIQIGGDEGFNVYNNTVEIYDAETDTWTLVDSVPYHVESHLAYLISGNRVVIIGGILDGASTDSVYVYDVEGDTWTAMSNMPKRLSSISSTMLEDGRIFVTCGWTYEIAEVNSDSYIFDPELDSWTTVAPIPKGMANAACQLIEGNKVWVCAGLDNSFNTSGDCYIYDVETDTWATSTSLPYAQSGGIASVKLYNGNIITVGGFDFTTFEYNNQVMLFNASEETWTEFATLDYGISNVMLVELLDSTVLLAGGNNNSKSDLLSGGNIEKTAAFYKGLPIANTNKGSYASAYIIDVEENTLESIEDLPRVTTGAQSVLLENQNVLMSGGSGSTMADETYDDALIYNNPNPVNPGVGVEEIAADNIAIAPNPSNGMFSINGINENDEIFILNTSGQCVYSQVVTENNITIDLRGISSGIYFIKTKNSNKYEKLIIK